mgnify:CR=1 FL=1
MCSVVGKKLRFTIHKNDYIIEYRLHSIFDSIMQKLQANFLLSSNTIELLKSHVPNKKRSEFIEDIIIKELKKRNFLKVLKKSNGAWKKRDLDSESFIRSLRSSKRI